MQRDQEFNRILSLLSRMQRIQRSLALVIAATLMVFPIVRVSAEENRGVKSEIAQWIEQQFYHAYFGYDPNSSVHYDDRIVKWRNKVRFEANYTFLDATFENNQELKALVNAEMSHAFDQLNSLGLEHEFSINDAPMSSFATLYLLTKKSSTTETLREITSAILGEGTDLGALQANLVKRGSFTLVKATESGAILMAVGVVRVDLPTMAIKGLLRRSIVEMNGFTGGSLLLDQDSIFNNFDPYKTELNKLDALVWQLFTDRRVIPGMRVRQSRTAIQGLAKSLAASVPNVGTTDQPLRLFLGSPP